MSKVRTLIHLVKRDRKKLGEALMRNIGLSKFSHIIPDECYVKMQYRLITGKPLDLKNPRTFNEKLQWSKLHDHNPLYTKMVDKYEVKEIVLNRLNSDECIIPTIGIYEDVDDIDFNTLPNQFVLKCTHDSGSTIICDDKSNFDINFAKVKLKKCMRRNLFWWGREWPYKNVKPRILAESYIKDNDRSFLPVYKFFCFGGQPWLIQVIQNDKQENETVDYYDIEWNLLNIKQNFPNSDILLPKPKNLDKMLECARKLATIKEDFIRVDLYSVNEKVYFSEYTFYSDCGCAAFSPSEWDDILGEQIVLPKL